ncbi:hypothetical protein CGRA01v4_05494 [Colletotrichum graminicola]|nr:hypothetical protein CGRA01v4_05494 [Colletotrichum graminicola]
MGRPCSSRLDRCSHTMCRSTCQGLSTSRS